MSNVIDSFLVALGFELDDKSVKEVEGAIGGVQTTALQMGAALSTAFVATGYAAKGATERVADLHDIAKRLEIAPKTLDAWGKATRMAGGEAGDLYSTFKSINDLLANATLKGEGPWENLAVAGIDSDFLSSAENAVELFERLAEIYPLLSRDQKKFAAKSFGLNDGTDKLLRAGPDQVDAWLTKAGELGLVSDEMGESAKRLQEASVNLSISFDHLLELFGTGAADGMTDAVADFTKLLTEFHELASYLGDTYGDYFDVAAPAAAAGTLAAALAAVGAAANTIGLTSFGSLLTSAPALVLRGGLYGGAAYTGYKGGQWLDANLITPWIKEKTGYESVGDFTYGYLNNETSPFDLALDRASLQSDYFGPGDSKTNTVINHIRNDITVDGAGSPDETARKVVEQINKSANMAADAMESGLAG